MGGTSDSTRMSSNVAVNSLTPALLPRGKPARLSPVYESTN